MHDGRKRDVRGDSPIREVRWLAQLLPVYNNSYRQLHLNDTGRASCTSECWWPGHSSPTSTPSFYKVHQELSQVWGQGILSPWAASHPVSNCPCNKTSTKQGPCCSSQGSVTLASQPTTALLFSLPLTFLVFAEQQRVLLRSRTELSKP